MIRFALGLIFIPFLIIVLVAIVVALFQQAPWLGIIGLIFVIGGCSSAYNKRKQSKK